MGSNPLDPNSKFWEDMQDVVFICIKKDRTINLQTSVTSMEELKSVFSTAYMMALFHDMKSDPKDIDRMH